MRRVGSGPSGQGTSLRKGQEAGLQGSRTAPQSALALPGSSQRVKVPRLPEDSTSEAQGHSGSHRLDPTSSFSHLRAPGREGLRPPEEAPSTRFPAAGPGQASLWITVRTLALRTAQSTELASVLCPPASKSILHPGRSLQGWGVEPGQSGSASLKR